MMIITKLDKNFTYDHFLFCKYLEKVYVGGLKFKTFTKKRLKS